MKRRSSLLTACITTFIALFCASGIVFAQAISDDKKEKPKLELSHFALPAQAPGGMQIDELSDLAWDADENLLYAISDKGNLFHFRLKVLKNKILSAEVVYSTRLTLTEEEGSTPSAADMEGLTLLNANNGRAGDTELIIVTENKPYYIYYTPKGNELRHMAVPAPLDNPLVYQGKNKGLESVFNHGKYGLLTGPELPLKEASATMHTLYGQRHQWSFPRYSSTARLKAMTVLPDGNLMVLERTKLPAKSLLPSLRYVNLRDCLPGSICSVVEKAVLPISTDNFEGLTHFKGKQFLIVSDQNAKDKQGGMLVLITLH